MRKRLFFPSCGDTISRPLESTAIETQEPSPGSEECNNSALKPGNKVNCSAGVAWGIVMMSPHGFTPSFPRLTALVQLSTSRLRANQFVPAVADETQLVSVSR